MKRFLPSLILTVPFFIGCPGGESSDDSAAALLLLGAGETTQATCSLVSAHGTTVMPLFTLTGDRSVTAQVQDNAHAHWMAFSIPNVQDGTEVDFSFDPKYTPGDLRCSSFTIPPPVRLMMTAPVQILTVRPLWGRLNG